MVLCGLQDNFIRHIFLRPSSGSELDRTLGVSKLCLWINSYSLRIKSYQYEALTKKKVTRLHQRCCEHAVATQIVVSIQNRKSPFNIIKNGRRSIPGLISKMTSTTAETSVGRISPRDIWPRTCWADIAQGYLLDFEMHVGWIDWILHLFYQMHTNCSDN